MLFNSTRGPVASLALSALSVLLSTGLGMLAGCGQGASGLSAPVNSAGPAAPESTDPLVAELQALSPRLVTLPELQPELHGLQSLPGFKDLEGYGRSASVTGPGYQSVHPQSYLEQANAVDDGPVQVKLQPVDALAYTLYALDGFKDDMFPTSLRVTLAPGSEGPEYFVAFADYHHQRWAFSGPFVADAEVQIPFSDQPKGLLDFISPGGSCFFTIIRGNPNADPDGLSLAALELGVDGGAAAPRPPSLTSTDGGAAGVWLTWLDSPDSGDADFSGYIVERAPLLAGSFEPISGEPSRDLYFWDTTGLPDTNYRYRVGAFDTSGNRSYTFVLTLGAVSSETLAPIPVLDLPEGKLSGPATVTFDLSGSIEPNGGVIDTYEISLFGLPTVSGANPLIELVLQPGCYFGAAIVSVGAVDSQIFFSLKVYPQWGNADQLVLPATGVGFSRFSNLRAGKLPGSGATTLIGWDMVSNGIAIRTDLGGGNWSYLRQPFYPGVLRISETVVFGDYLAFAVLTNNGDVVALLYDGESCFFGSVHGEVPGTVTPALVVAGDQLLLVYAYDNMGQTDLRYVDALNGDYNNGPTLVANAGPVTALDCVYNPAAGSLETIYFEGANVRWQSWDLASATENTSDIVAMLANVTNLDAELDPLAQEPSVAYYAGPAARWSFSRHSGAGWSAPLLIDNANDNSFAGDLLYRDGVCHFAMATYGGIDVLQIQDFDPGVPAWNLRGSFELLAVPGAEIGLLPGSAPNELLVAQVDGASGVHLHSCLDDDTELGTFYLQPEAAQGWQMRGAHGSDGLHMIQVNAGNKPDGAYSTDGGLSWTPYAGAPAYVTSVDIGAQASGEVYVSANNADFSGIYELLIWDPMTLNFNSVDSTAFGIPNHWPSLSCSRVHPNVYWTVFDEVLGELHNYNGNSGGAFADDIISPLIAPIWNSCRSGFSGSFLNGPFVFAGGMAPYECVQGRFLTGADDFQFLTDTLFLNEPPTDFMTNDRVRGRTMDSAVCIVRPEIFFLPYDLSEVYVSAFGPLFNAYRYEHSLQFGDASISDIEMDFELTSAFSSELMRTVSVCEANGPTALSLVSTFDGSTHSFQWSNFGQWEDLVLPQIENMSKPELLVGTDGRWHLLYHDFVTDEIKVRSTL